MTMISQCTTYLNCPCVLRISYPSQKFNQHGIHCSQFQIYFVQVPKTKPDVLSQTLLLSSLPIFGPEVTVLRIWAPQHLLFIHIHFPVHFVFYLVLSYSTPFLETKPIYQHESKAFKFLLTLSLNILLLMFNTMQMFCPLPHISAHVFSQRHYLYTFSWPPSSHP